LISEPGKGEMLFEEKSIFLNPSLFSETLGMTFEVHIITAGSQDQAYKVFYALNLPMF
jgi:hypothetical protein